MPRPPPDSNRGQCEPNVIPIALSTTCRGHGAFADFSLTCSRPGLDAGGTHAEGLRRLAAKYGTPTEEELTSLLVSEYRCDPAAANLLAKCFGHFCAGRFLEVTHLAAPATKAAARRLLRELDEGVYQVQVGKSAGRYPGLGVLLDELLSLAQPTPPWC